MSGIGSSSEHSAQTSGVAGQDATLEPGNDPGDSLEAVEPANVAAESPVLVHVWEILDPAQEDVALQRLDKMLTETATQPGFVSARVLQSADRRSIAVLLEIGSAEDRQRLEELPIVRETLHHLDATMNIIIKLYHQVSEYHGRGPSG